MDINLKTDFVLWLIAWNGVMINVMFVLMDSIIKMENAFKLVKINIIFYLLLIL